MVTDRTWTRRRLLTYGLSTMTGLAVAGVAGVELVSHGVLPGKGELDQLEGACSVPSPRLVFSPLGQSTSGRFLSRARRRVVGYTIALPPGHRTAVPLPLIVVLHGYGANHVSALAGMSLAQAVALHVNGKPLAPFAMVSVDGGGGYWNRHPGDDPMAMLTGELIPMCQSLGLGRPPGRIGAMGISMGGYGALLLAEKHPELLAAVAAISPAVWTSYSQAKSANAGAYASAEDFAADDAVTHAHALHGIAVRVASGNDDPFHPGVVALANALPSGSVVRFSPGCHSEPFFVEQEVPSLAFLAEHLS